jgi:hypothetical protein
MAEQQWQVGQLYKGGLVNGLPVWTQATPGGIVEPQLPTLFPTQFQGYQQVFMTYPAQYFFGCGHPQNCPEIFEVYDPVLQEQVALVCCSQCSFIEQILSPYSTFESYVDTPIIVA